MHFVFTRSADHGEPSSDIRCLRPPSASLVGPEERAAARLQLGVLARKPAAIRWTGEEGKLASGPVYVPSIPTSSITFRISIPQPRQAPTGSTKQHNRWHLIKQSRSRKQTKSRFSRRLDRNMSHTPRQTLSCDPYPPQSIFSAALRPKYIFVLFPSPPMTGKVSYAPLKSVPTPR
jgi:hypothetical protein